MLSRDILEQQDYEYALSLIEDMERESLEAELRQNNEQQKNEQEIEEQETEEYIQVEEERNPSPYTLRNMRRAYFEALEIKRRTPPAEVAVPISVQSAQTQPVQTQPAHIQPAQIQPAQIQSAQIQSAQTRSITRRLRSGSSY